VAQADQVGALAAWSGFSMSESRCVMASFNTECYNV